MVSLAPSIEYTNMLSREVKDNAVFETILARGVKEVK